jgi:hypothetical protein
VGFYGLFQCFRKKRIGIIGVLDASCGLYRAYQVCAMFIYQQATPPRRINDETTAQSALTILQPRSTDDGCTDSRLGITISRDLFGNIDDQARTEDDVSHAPIPRKVGTIKLIAYDNHNYRVNREIRCLLSSAIIVTQRKRSTSSHVSS